MFSLQFNWSRFSDIFRKYLLTVYSLMHTPRTSHIKDEKSKKFRMDYRLCVFYFVGIAGENGFSPDSEEIKKIF